MTEPVQEHVQNNGESPPTQRRTRRGGRLIDQPFTAKLIASQLLVRADELRSTAQHEPRSAAEQRADADLADLLKTAADELRAVS